MSIQDNISYIKKNITELARSSGREPSGITLLGATKTVGPDRIKEAINCGLYDFGENYAQEFRDKYPELDDYNERINWHFIGGLQKNKVKYLVGKVSLIQSVDSLSLAEEINKRYSKEGIMASVLIEINNGEEESKEGISIDEAEKLLAEIKKLESIEVKGFMTMAPYYEDPENARPLFKEVAGLKKTMSRRHEGLVHLSMGMSNDYKIALEEGSTILRIGSLIFGERVYG